ncbi:GntR family transcriptional regulator [Undibacterium sp. Di24W]|uniref:GntR family transcriptional regulator n=1 Tax=Undibacterium sp. Di24W TaxID=3413033 RepID=UPI003BF35DF4
MNYDIHPSSSTPIFRQIIDQVRRFIASGQLRSGDTLPSVRTVAMQHAINPMTVSKAYNMLEIEGVLVRMRGVGMVIAERRNTAKDKTNLAMPSMLSAAQVAHQLGLEKTQALKLFEQALKTIENESRKNAD